MMDSKIINIRPGPGPEPRQPGSVPEREQESRPRQSGCCGLLNGNNRVVMFFAGTLLFGAACAAVYGIYYIVRGHGTVESINQVDYVNSYNISNCAFQTTAPPSTMPSCASVLSDFKIPVQIRCHSKQPGPPAGYLLCDYRYMDKTVAIAHIGFSASIVTWIETRRVQMTCTGGSVSQVLVCIRNQTAHIPLHNIRYSRTDPDRDNNSRTVWYTDSSVAPVSLRYGIMCFILAVASGSFVVCGLMAWFQRVRRMCELTFGIR